MLARLALALALAAPLAPASAQEADGPCVERDASAIIHVLVCREGTTDEMLVAAARAACAGKLPCGVWFWTSEAAAPLRAPANHDGLTPAQVTSSLGVFAAEDDALIRIAPIE